MFGAMTVCARMVDSIRNVVSTNEFAQARCSVFIWLDGETAQLIIDVIIKYFSV